MKKELIKDQWYKFSPYKGRLEQVWYMKYRDGYYNASEFINHHGAYNIVGGSFSDYAYQGVEHEYQPATAQEVNKYLPDNKKISEQLPIFN